MVKWLNARGIMILIKWKQVNRGVPSSNPADIIYQFSILVSVLSDQILILTLQNLDFTTFFELYLIFFSQLKRWEWRKSILGIVWENTTQKKLKTGKWYQLGSNSVPPG